MEMEQFMTLLKANVYYLIGTKELTIACGLLT